MHPSFIPNYSQFLLLIPLMIPGPSSACKIITKPVPWNNQIQPWNIFNQPKPKPTQAPSSPTTSYQPPSCTCGEKVGAGAKQHPWLVGIGLANDDDGALLCSGSLLTSDTVLTAASCLQQLTPALLSVLVGGHSLLAGDGERVPVDSILLHPDFDPLTNEADLALVGLQEPVQFGKRVGLACLPREGAALQMRDALMVGWGLNSSSSGVPDLPQVAELETLSNPICTGPTTVYTTDDIAGGMLCAREGEGFSSCVGDIGSPLMMPEGGGRFYAQIMIKMILGHI